MTCSGLDFSPWFLAWAALIFFLFFFQAGSLLPVTGRLQKFSHIIREAGQKSNTVGRSEGYMLLDSNHTNWGT